LRGKRRQQASVYRRIWSIPKSANLSRMPTMHGITTDENRAWERGYRDRWAHDKIVRSTHGVNCTGSCSWKIYVKNGLITWETQQTDYPRTRPDLPNHEPRGCSRGASYSWYIYSANRLKYPMVRKRLLNLWRRKAQNGGDPVKGWAAIQNDPVLRAEYQKCAAAAGLCVPDGMRQTRLLPLPTSIRLKSMGRTGLSGFRLSRRCR
jgi:nitrate reductase alpha subunit